LDNIYVGRADGANGLTSFTLTCPFKQPGTHQLNILSLTQGLANGADYELSRGLLGAVNWDNVDLTKQSWTHQPGTLGELLHVYTDAGQKAFVWNNGTAPMTTPIWYKMSFTTPTPMGDPAYATWQFDMSVMGKGELWVNGFMVGAYWSIKDGSGQYSQQYYHIPRDYLMPAGQANLVVVLEETTMGNPSKIVLSQRNSIGAGQSSSPSKLTVSAA